MLCIETRKVRTSAKEMIHEITRSCTKETLSMYRVFLRICSCNFVDHFSSCSKFAYFEFRLRDSIDYQA